MDIAEYSADEDGKEEGEASLHIATKEGNIDIVKLLLKLGKDINGRNTANQTPLVSGASNRNLDVVRLLIERGAEVDSRDIFGWTPLHYTSQDGHVEVSRVLTSTDRSRDHGANVDARQRDHWSPIHFSPEEGHLGMVKLLLKRGADLHGLKCPRSNTVPTIARDPSFLHFRRSMTGHSLPPTCPVQPRVRIDPFPRQISRPPAKILKAVHRGAYL